MSSTDWQGVPLKSSPSRFAVCASSPPYEARVGFYMVYNSPAHHNVPNELIPINPLGLAITYFREDQAFR